MLQFNLEKFLVWFETQFDCYDWCVGGDQLHDGGDVLHDEVPLDPVSGPELLLHFTGRGLRSIRGLDVLVNTNLRNYRLKKVRPMTHTKGIQFAQQYCRDESS